MLKIYRYGGTCYNSIDMVEHAVSLVVGQHRKLNLRLTWATIVSDSMIYMRTYLNKQTNKHINKYDNKEPK